MGRLNWLRYWIKAWILPIVILPWIANHPPSIDTATKLALSKKFIMGCKIPEKNWDFQALLYSSLLILRKVSMDCCSPLKALTIVWPENISSTWPLIAPKETWWLKKYFCDFLMINLANKKPSGKIMTAIKVNCQLIIIIIMRIPTTVVTAVTTWVKLWLKLWLIVSTSLVTRLRISPWLWLSK